MFESIVEAVADYAVKIPNRLCVADRSCAYTYGEIWRLVKIAAQKLQSLGVKKKDFVMVECTQEADFVICDLACELIGAVFVPVEHRASEDRVRIILEETNASLFLCSSKYEAPVTMRDAAFLTEEQKEADPEEQLPQTVQFPKAEETAEILYTTGTTGTSKGIEVTHGNNIALAENVKYGTEMKADNIELIPLPLSHSHGLRCCYANLLNGSTVVLIEGVSWVKRVFGLIERYKVTALDISPSALTVLHKLAGAKLSEISGQIDYIQVGTEALPEDVKEILISCFPSARLYNFYGSTESGRTCVLDFNKDRGRAGCIGKPTRNATFIVTNEKREPIVSSEENMGLLATAGPMNMKGYWKQPKLTEQIMQNGFIYTNDLGYIDADGYVYMRGRKDDVINYKGIKIAPEEIEESVRKYEEIVDCACVPKEDKLSGQVPKLFVVVREKEKFQKKELFEFLKKYIDANKMPKEIEVIDEIPRTYNGKIQRRKLVEKNETV
ncbi:long-chain fatty acid--CoA ligase [Lachnospiraceae bacterium]|nr:long-chain fatty acid--CoA ligase [Lachnospiraceae bacterium]